MTVASLPPPLKMGGGNVFTLVVYLFVGKKTQNVIYGIGQQ